jgi:proliferating cell nuclear antigen PCNA
MKLVIKDKQKAEKFSHIFRHLKQFVDIISLYFDNEKLYAQGMDGSHVGLFELSISKEWFDEYEINKEDVKNIATKTSILHKVINTREENQSISIEYDNFPDKLNISFESDIKEEYNKYFELSLIDLSEDLMNLDGHECQVDMIFPTKNFSSLIEQHAIFNDNIQIFCSEEEIKFTTKGDEGEMKVKMSIDDLNEYAIEEDKEITQSFSLNHLNTMCQFNKLSSEVLIGFCEDKPMLMKYILDDVNPSIDNEEQNVSSNYIRFFLAPKINDDDE